MRLRSLTERFLRDEDGNALVFVAIMLPVLVGFALLAIDMSRANSLHNDMQSGADAFALAAAAELDGHSDAITRANRAITNLITSNATKFASAGNRPMVPGDLTVTYLTSIPASDSIALSAAGVASTGVDFSTTNPVSAKFVEVTVNPTGFATIFPASFLGATGSFNVQTQAVAGYGSALCNFTPMFICNPYTSLQALQNALTGTKKPMVWLKEQGGNNAQYGPGNYGFLSSPEGDKSAKTLEAMFAETNPPACFGQSTVTTRPGNVSPMGDGLNVRFDEYPNGNSTNNNKFNGTDDPPAPNVRKGMVVQGAGGNNCKYAAPSSGQASKYMALPRDSCFLTGGACLSTVGMAGDGTWNFTSYWSVNHPSVSSADVTTSSHCGASPSRYCVYQYEINHPTLGSGPEATAPKCNATTLTADRRLIYVAVIDCVANNVHGGGQSLPVQAYLSMFVTEPAGSPPNTDVYAELEDVSTKTGQNTLQKLQRNEAQLYR